MQNRPLIAASILALTTGCVVYDGKCKDKFGWEDSGWSDWEDSGSWDDGDGPDDEAPVASFALVPDEVQAGETVITGLQADIEFDYNTIVALEFFGPVELCTKSVRSDELLLTVSAEADAPAMMVDLLLDFEDGSSVLVEDALRVIDADGNEPGQDDGPDGTEDPGGDDGSAGGDDGSAGGDNGSSDDDGPC